MTEQVTFFQEISSTREEILEATFYALCEHGYANLTIKKIGAELDKSQSLIYHHYDDKDDLLLDLLEYMLEELEAQVPFPNQSAEEYITLIVDQMFGESDQAHAKMGQAIIELRAQAAHDELYADLFRRSDDFIRKQITQVLRMGAEKGTFDVESPKETAALFETVLIGIQGERLTNDEAIIQDAKSEFLRYVENCILTDIN